MRTIRRPAALELAEVVRRHGHRLGELCGEQRRILRAIRCCRTAALGGHVETCDRCPYRRIAYNSCRNRHCPKCRGSACARWMADRAGELLEGVEYFHVVFTLPEEFNALALGNKRVVYNALFDAAAKTLLEVAADPKRLGAKIGFLAILHTWGQNLSLHPHVHCVVPGGGLAPDGSRWVACRPGFFLPVRVLSRVFRGKFVEGLRRSARAGKLVGAGDDAAFERMLERSVRREWVVYAKPPFGSAERVLKYLARYTHRIAISDRRLVAMDDRTVSFTWKDYARGGSRRRTMTLDGAEFLRRFLLHAVPRGFVRVRHYGLLANRVRAKNLALCRRLLATPAAAARVSCGDPQAPCCPACGRGRLLAGPHLSPGQLAVVMARLDSS